MASFVVSELMKLAGWSGERLSFSQYRDKDQNEVDVVIEDRHGRVIGVEVKAAASVNAADFRGLKRLKEATGDKFEMGLVLYDHDRAVPFGDRLWAAPISCLFA